MRRLILSTLTALLLGTAGPAALAGDDAEEEPALPQRLQELRERLEQADSPEALREIARELAGTRARMRAEAQAREARLAALEADIARLQAQLTRAREEGDLAALRRLREELQEQMQTLTQLRARLAQAAGDRPAMPRLRFGEGERFPLTLQGRVIRRPDGDEGADEDVEQVEEESVEFFVLPGGDDDAPERLRLRRGGPRLRVLRGADEQDGLVVLEIEEEVEEGAADSDEESVPVLRDVPVLRERVERVVRRHVRVHDVRDLLAGADGDEGMEGFLALLESEAPDLELTHRGSTVIATGPPAAQERLAKALAALRQATGQRPRIVVRGPRGGGVIGLGGGAGGARPPAPPRPPQPPRGARPPGLEGADRPALRRERAEVERRLAALRRAHELLDQAGAERAAQQLARQAEELERRLQALREQAEQARRAREGARGPRRGGMGMGMGGGRGRGMTGGGGRQGPPAGMAEAVRDLHREVSQLRGEVAEIKRMLQELLAQRRRR